jgi:hypothetical protein
VSVRQAEQVAALIQKLMLPMNAPWNGRPVAVEGPPPPPIELGGGIELTLLSPRPQDLDRLANFWERSLRGAADSSDIDTDEAAQRADEAIGAEPLVYVASAHQDELWRGRLQQALASLLPEERVTWSGKMSGDEASAEAFRQQRQFPPIAHVRIAVVLASPAALASDWVQQDIDMLASAATRSQMVLTWIPLRPFSWDDTPLSKYQALVSPNEPLSALSDGEQIAQLALERTEKPTDPSRRQRAAAEGPIDVEVLTDRPFVADRSVINNASLAFLAERQGKSLLICGDASADVLAESIRGLIRQRGVSRLRVDAIVVPHGGSAHNLHRQLLELLDCDRYLIATSGERYRHPDRETIARILAFGRTDRSVPLTLVFNYRAPTTAVWDDPELQRRWNYRAIYPQHEGGGIKVRI